MSTKIYRGYRVRAEHFNDFLRHLRQGTMEKAVGQVKAIMAAVKPEVIPALIEKYHLADFKPRDGLPSDFVEQCARYQFVEEKLKEHHDNQARFEVFDVQAAWVFFLSGEYFYGWPSDMIQLEHEKVMAFGRVEDYCYWNSTDGPEEISREEWEARGEMWHKVTLNPRLIYYIVDYSPGSYESQGEIMQRILAPKTLSPEVKDQL
jgi:hypothetical protein